MRVPLFVREPSPKKNVPFTVRVPLLPMVVAQDCPDPPINVRVLEFPLMFIDPLILRVIPIAGEGTDPVEELVPKPALSTNVSVFPEFTVNVGGVDGVLEICAYNATPPVPELPVYMSFVSISKTVVVVVVVVSATVRRRAGAKVPAPVIVRVPVML